MKNQLLSDLYNQCSKEAVDYADRKLVFGEGNADTDIVFIGEAPGGDEEKQGHPFVGKAGKNLSEFLEVVNLKREDIYITNVVKLRPTKSSEKTGNLVNRPPNKKEIKFFVPFLLKEIDIIIPKIIVTLGNVSLKAVLEDEDATIGEYHGKVIQKGSYKVFPLYHPASIIYNQSLKEVYYQDLNNIKKLIS